MKIGNFTTRGASLCRLLALCVIGSPLFFGTQVAYSQSSLESDVDNARIIEMTHKGLGDDVIIARGGYPPDSGSPYRLWFGFGLR